MVAGRMEVLLNSGLTSMIVSSDYIKVDWVRMSHLTL